MGTSRLATFLLELGVLQQLNLKDGSRKEQLRHTSNQNNLLYYSRQLWLVAEKTFGLPIGCKRAHGRFTGFQLDKEGYGGFSLVFVTEKARKNCINSRVTRSRYGSVIGQKIDHVTIFCHPIGPQDWTWRRYLATTPRAKFRTRWCRREVLDL